MEIPMKALALSALLSTLAAVPATAVTLAGDTVTLSYDGVFSESTTVLVGAGEDGNFFGNQFFDLDSGPGGDVFTIRSSGNFCGIWSCSGPISLTLSDLDFGVPLTSVGFLTNLVGATVSSLTATSVTFSWSEVDLSVGEYLSVQFNSSPAPVPVPATLPLMLLALGGLGMAARRRQN
jgi:hypothetical protein